MLLIGHRVLVAYLLNWFIVVYWEIQSCMSQVHNHISILNKYAQKGFPKAKSRFLFNCQLFEIGKVKTRLLLGALECTECG